MRTAPEAIAHAKTQTRNKPGMCQNWTWNVFAANAVGDVDRDGDADAVDGWKSEPKKAQHTDRRPAIGAPGAWSGGSGGFGHRAPCVGYVNGVPIFRSTDAGGRGIIANRSLDWFEREWGLKWLGWSETISGRPIEGLEPAPGSVKEPEKTAPVDTRSRGEKIDHAIKDLNEAEAAEGTPRYVKIKTALKVLNSIAKI